jgi:hypothetical protein
MPEEPPVFARFLLRTFAGTEHDDIQGDMAECFQHIRESQGAQEARRFYWTRTFGCVWPLFIRAVCQTMERVFGLILMVLPGGRRVSCTYAVAQGMPLPSEVTDTPRTAGAGWPERLALLAYIFCLVTIGWMVWEADRVYGLTLILRGNLFIGGMVLLVTLPYLIARCWRQVAIGLTISAIAVLSLSFVDQSPTKALLRLEPRFQKGMPQAQVEQLVAEYFPQNGQFGNPRWENNALQTEPFGPEGTARRILYVGKSGMMVVTYTADRRVVEVVVED